MSTTTSVGDVKIKFWGGNGRQLEEISDAAIEPEAKKMKQDAAQEFGTGSSSPQPLETFAPIIHNPDRLAADFGMSLQSSIIPYLSIFLRSSSGLRSRVKTCTVDLSGTAAEHLYQMGMVQWVGV